MTEIPDRTLAELAALKRMLGATLSDPERRALARFEATAAGRTFTRETERLGAGLARLRTARPAGDAAAFAARIEAGVRREAEQARRRFAGFCLGVLAFCGAGAVLPFVFPHPRQTPERVHDLWILLGGLAVVICTAVGLRIRQTLRADDVLELLRSTERPVKSVSRQLLDWWLIAFLTVLVARHVGWTQAVLGLVVTYSAMLLLARWLRASLRARRLQQDEEAWRWWYGE